MLIRFEEGALRDAARCLQLFSLVGLFPGKFRKLATKMAVCRSFAIDRTAQIKLVDDGTRTQVDHLVYRYVDVDVGTMPVPNVSTITETGRASPMA